MPTDISNSVGTARQFTPQPDSTYQGRYLGVSPTQSSRSANDPTADLATNLIRLSDALQTHRLSHERWLDEIGAIDAENMIHGMTQEDIEHLGVIDAAQQEGYADVTANPYFRAYANKLRGQFLASQMKKDYDNTFSMQPAPTMRAEQQRYNTFASNWKDAHINDMIDMNTAFNMGFDENSIINMGQLGKEWIQNKHQEDVTNTVTEVQSKLSDIIRTAPALREQNGAITEKVQEVFNTAALMGVPAAQRNTLAFNFVKQLGATGALDGKRIYQMAQAVTVQTSIDGTKTKLADILPMTDVQLAADEYHRMQFTQERQDTIDKLVATGSEKNINDYFADMSDKDPLRTREYMEDRQRAITQLKQTQAEQKAEIAAKAREDKQNMKVVLQQQQARGALQAWTRGEDMYNGTSIHAMSFSDKQALSSLMVESLQYLLAVDGNGNFVNNGDPNDPLSDKGRMKYLGRIMSFPPASSMIKGLQQQYESNIDTIQPDGNGGNTASQTAYTLYRLYATNTPYFQQAFGTSLAEKMGVIARLTNIYNGDTTAALNTYATYNVTPKETTDAYKSDIRAYLNSNQNGYPTNNYSVELPSLGENGTIGHYYLYQNEQGIQKFQTLGAVFLATTGGNSLTGAINNVGAILQENYRYYHTTIIPKMLWANLGCGGDDETWMYNALNSLVYNFAGSYYNASEMICDYNTESNILTITNPYTHQSVPYDKDALRNQAQWLYGQQAQKQTHSYNDSKAGNAERHAYTGSSAIANTAIASNDANYNVATATWDWIKNHF